VELAVHVIPDNMCTKSSMCMFGHQTYGEMTRRGEAWMETTTLENIDMNFNFTRGCSCLFCFHFVMSIS
jgi:hypothetical protein